MNDDLISRQTAIDDIETVNPSMPLSINWVKNWVKTLPPSQPELIERTAYIRGFEQGRTQGMIDSQGGKNMIKAEWTNADALNLQPTCNQLATDCISRQAAIDVAKEELDNGTFYDIPSKIEQLPSAQPEKCEDCENFNKTRLVIPQPERKTGRWIPVTERLPEIDMSHPHHEDYLVQYDSGGIDVASWSNVNRFWTDHVTEPYWNCVQFAKVIAWMPLPEPYKEVRDEYSN